MPILTYHSLDDSGSVISTSPATFARQMETLWQKGYKTLSLSEAADIIHQDSPFPTERFVITFDDGYENVYHVAMPVLRQFGFKATVFLITDYCGKLNDWAGHSSSIERRPLLSWSQMNEMIKSEFEAGVHTATHPDLTRIPIEQAESEIIRSKQTIQDKLGVKADLFAYPYGKSNSRVLNLVREQFAVACTTRLGKVQRGCDPYLVSRVDMYYLSSSRLFDAISTSGFDRYLSVRSAFRRLREAVA